MRRPMKDVWTKMAVEKKILVVLDSESKELGPLHHALALAQRIGAQVILLRIEPPGERTPFTSWVDDAVIEIMNRAREADIAVSCNSLRSRSGEAVLGFIQEQGPDLLVIGEKEIQWGKDLLQVKTGLPSQIIRVKEKGDANVHPKAKRS